MASRTLALARLARANGARRMPKLGRQQHPDAVARSYLDALRKGPLASLRALVSSLLESRLKALALEAERNPIARADADDVGDIIDDIKERFGKMWSSAHLRAIARNAFEATSRFNARQLNAQLKPVFGVDLVGHDPRTFAGAMRADAVDEEGAARGFITENVTLIKSIPSAFLDELGKRVAKGLADGERPETLSKYIQERFAVAESRANLIARDQIGKLNGDLNQVRMRDLGLDRYIWRTMKDERVRDSHADRDGEVFKWSDPPGDPSDPSSYGHPGEPIMCRCFAEPFLDDILAGE